MYATRPPIKWNSEFWSSGRAKVNGSLPSNQGLTVWRSVETTSMGFVLARVETCKSAISAKRSCRCGRSQGPSASSTTTTAAVANAGPVNQEGRKLDRGAVTRRIFDCSSGDGTNLALAARLIEIFNFLLPKVAAAQS